MFARRAAQAISRSACKIRSTRNTAASVRMASVALTATNSVSATPSMSHAASTRGMKTLSFGGTNEKVTSRSDFPPERIKSILGSSTIAMIGYGSQGRGQALNMIDNGLKVILGLREGESYDRAKADGFVPGKNLFSISEAAQKGDILMYMLSDAGQKAEWKTVSKHLTKGKTLFFSHGFSVVYHDQTGVIPPKDVDVVMVAPKGSGTTVRSLFLDGRGINSSVAVHQDATGKAEEKAYALGVALGSGYLYETTFEKEVYSDLVGERGALMGALQGLFLAQYEVLRENGHSPSEAFNETVEEATQSLYPLVGERGMDWMFSNCSTTARRGAIDWYPKFYEANKPVFQKLYAAVKDGSETARTLETNSKPDYAKQLRAELKEIGDSEMWKTGEVVRSLRPERHTDSKHAKASKQ